MAENKCALKRRRRASSSENDAKKIPLRDNKQEESRSNCVKKLKTGALSLSCQAKRTELWLPEDFQVQELLGSGGFGQVYRATDKRTGLVYALKKQKIEGDDDEEAAINSEWQVYQEIGHPNIVKCYGSFFTPDSMNLVLDYCETGNLYEVMSNTSEKLTQNMIRRFTRDMLDALIYLHKDVGLIHMDLKPENVMVTGGVAKLCDFGVALRVIGMRTVLTQHEGGTVTYRPPEIFRGEGFDSTVDVWALGCIVYEMRFLSHPFFDVWDPGFKYSDEEELKGLNKMDSAQTDGIFAGKNHLRCQRSLKAFIEKILCASREDRPLATELSKSWWLNGR